MDYTVPMPGTDARHWWEQGAAAEAAARTALHTDGSRALVDVVDGLAAQDEDGTWTTVEYVERIAGIYLSGQPLRARLRYARRLLLRHCVLR